MTLTRLLHRTSFGQGVRSKESEMEAYWNERETLSRRSFPYVVTYIWPIQLRDAFEQIIRPVFSPSYALRKGRIRNNLRDQFGYGNGCELRVPHSLCCMMLARLQQMSISLIVWSSLPRHLLTSKGGILCERYSIDISAIL